MTLPEAMKKMDLPPGTLEKLDTDVQIDYYRWKWQQWRDHSSHGAKGINGMLEELEQGCLVGFSDDPAELGLDLSKSNGDFSWVNARIPTATKYVTVLKGLLTKLWTELGYDGHARTAMINSDLADQNELLDRIEHVSKVLQERIWSIRNFGRKHEAEGGMAGGT